MDKNHFLSKQDVEALKRLKLKVQKDPGRQAHENEQTVEFSGDEMFIAVPPCGEGIPARSGTTPGSNFCCLFKLVATSPSSGVTGFEYKILPLLEPGTGTPVRATVYNIYDQAIPARLPPNEKYIQIKKDKLGKWLAVPSNLFAAAETTTTPASGIVPQTCTGNCKWTWNGTCWTNTGCTTSTTTSTSTSSSTTTSTSTSPCLCQGTTSTTSTTTTTGCSFCSYPPFCGTTVGQCYFSTCVEKDPGQYSSCSCSTTTTPSCNCNTTSTAGPCYNPPCGGQSDNCGGNCVWYHNGTNWILSYQGCLNCIPPSDTVDKCAAYVSYCGGSIYDFIQLFPGFGGGSGGPCSNSVLPPKCCWCYWTAINDWVFDSGECCAGGEALGPLKCHFDAAGVAYCTGGWACPKPSFVPNMGSSTCGQGCSITYTTDMVPYCSLYPSASCDCDCSNGTGPTTTLAPGATTTTAAPGTNACTCGHCYTTTTQAPVNSGYCLWQCSSPGGSWGLLSSSCPASYSCSAPSEVCRESCQTQISSCTTSTTTT